MLLGYCVVEIIIGILIAVWCAGEAKKKGRNTSLAFLLGLVFGLFAAVGYALLKSKIQPICPECEATTTLRTVMKGKDKGKKFYVCNNYPECEGRIKA